MTPLTPGAHVRVRPTSSTAWLYGAHVGTVTRPAPFTRRLVVLFDGLTVPGGRVAMGTFREDELEVVESATGTA